MLLPIKALVVQDNAEEGIVDVDFAVVFDETHFPEFVHEKIDSRPSGANHLREHLLRYFGEPLVRTASRAIVCEQQQVRASRFSRGVEELIDQVRFDSEISRQHVAMKRSENSCSPWSTRIISFLSITTQLVGAIVVAVATQSEFPARQPSPKKLAGAQDRDNGFFAGSLTTVSLAPPS